MSSFSFLCRIFFLLICYAVRYLCLESANKFIEFRSAKFSGWAKNKIGALRRIYDAWWWTKSQARPQQGNGNFSCILNTKTCEQMRRNEIKPWDKADEETWPNKQKEHNKVYSPQQHWGIQWTSQTGCQLRCSGRESVCNSDWVTLLHVHVEQQKQKTEMNDEARVSRRTLTFSDWKLWTCMRWWGWPGRSAGAGPSCENSPHRRRSAQPSTEYPSGGSPKFKSEARMRLLSVTRQRSDFLFPFASTQTHFHKLATRTTGLPSHWREHRSLVLPQCRPTNVCFGPASEMTSKTNQDDATDVTFEVTPIDWKVFCGDSPESACPEWRSVPGCQCAPSQAAWTRVPSLRLLKHKENWTESSMEPSWLFRSETQTALMSCCVDTLTCFIFFVLVHIELVLDGDEIRLELRHILGRHRAQQTLNFPLALIGHHLQAFQMRQTCSEWCSQYTDENHSKENTLVCTSSVSTIYRWNRRTRPQNLPSAPLRTPRPASLCRPPRPSLRAESEVTDSNHVRCKSEGTIPPSEISDNNRPTWQTCERLGFAPVFLMVFFRPWSPSAKASYVFFPIVSKTSSPPTTSVLLCIGTNFFAKVKTSRPRCDEAMVWFQTILFQDSCSWFWQPTVFSTAFVVLSTTLLIPEGIPQDANQPADSSFSSLLRSTLSLSLLLSTFSFCSSSSFCPPTAPASSSSSEAEWQVGFVFWIIRNAANALKPSMVLFERNSRLEPIGVSPGLLSGAPFSDGSLAAWTARCCWTTSSGDGAPKLDSTVSSTVVNPSPTQQRQNTQNQSGIPQWNVFSVRVLLTNLAGERADGFGCSWENRAAPRSPAPSASTPLWKQNSVTVTRAVVHFSSNLSFCHSIVHWW